MVLPIGRTSTIDNTITCMYKAVHEKTVKFLKSTILYLIVSLLVEVHPNAIETISLNVNFFRFFSLISLVNVDFNP